MTYDTNKYDRTCGFWQKLLATLIIGVSVLMPQMSFAQVSEWIKGDEIKPLGSGTQSDPYLIAQAANLFWVSLNIRTVGSSNFYFVQTDDIDLQGRNWLPIGFFNPSSTDNADRMTFFGHYDGGGHKISGLRVDWGKGARYVDASGNIVEVLPTETFSDTPVPFGLFGYFGGEIKNVVIDGARIVQSVPLEDTYYNQDIAVGVLAGCAGDAPLKVTNVIIQDSYIRGSGILGRYSASAYMIGGLIGNIHGGNIRSTSYASQTYDISNLYVNVNIDIRNTSLSSKRNIDNKGYQYYVGGIIGRARSIKFDTQFPKNVVYSGDINAPYAIVGPIFSAARYSSSADVKSANGLKRSFAGDFYVSSGTYCPNPSPSFTQ